MVNKDRKTEVRAIIESVFSEAPMANAIDDVKLMPCPFCGGEVELQSSKTLGDRLFVIGCKSESPCLGSGLGIYVTQANLPEAISAWNRRASPAPSQHTGWSDEAVEALAMAEKRLVEFARAIDAGEAQGGAREWERRIWASFAEHRAALTAASSIAPATGFEVWQDIATAPKDGTAILITRPTQFESEEGWHVVRWDETWGDDGLWMCHDGKFDTPLRGADPTLWKALPSIAPSVAKESGEP